MCVVVGTATTQSLTLTHSLQNARNISAGHSNSQGVFVFLKDHPLGCESCVGGVDIWAKKGVFL